MATFDQYCWRTRELCRRHWSPLLYGKQCVRFPCSFARRSVSNDLQENPHKSQGNLPGSHVSLSTHFRTKAVPESRGRVQRGGYKAILFDCVLTSCTEDRRSGHKKTQR